MQRTKKQRMEAHALRKKQNRERQNEYITRLAAIKLTDDQRALMRSTKHFGQKMSKRDQLREDIRREKVGLDPIHMHLYNETLVDDTTFEDNALTLPLDPLESHSLQPSTDDFYTKEPVPKTVSSTDFVPLANCSDDGEKRENGRKPRYDVQGNRVIEDDLHIELYPERIFDALLYDEQVSFPYFCRPVEIEASRKNLPSFCLQYEFLDVLGTTDVLLVKGSTGSGKSTQIPQFLLEGGYSSLKAPYMSVGKTACQSNRDARYGYGGKILVTQPRRIAAIGVSTRIAEELGQTIGEVSGYIIKQNSVVNKSSDYATRIVCVTEGVLLKMIESDFLLSDVSTVILDEAHERSINFDLIIGLVSRISGMRRRMFNSWLRGYEKLILKLVELYKQFNLSAEPLPVHEDGKQNSGVISTENLTFQHARILFREIFFGTNPTTLPLGSDIEEYYHHLKELAILCQTSPPATPLKLIIMSATLQQADILNNEVLFHCKPKLFEIPMRTYPVAVHYNFTTDPDYVREAIEKASMIHRYYGPGTILIFLTGKREIETCITMLKDRLCSKNKRKTRRVNDQALRAKLSEQGVYRDIFDNSTLDNLYTTEQEPSDMDDEEESQGSYPVLKLMQKYVAELEHSKRETAPEELPANPEDNFELYNVILNGDAVANNDKEEDRQNAEQLMKEFKTCEVKRRDKVEENESLEPVILPLYGTLDIVEQAKVFAKDYQEQTKYRLIIVSTNVAEASITIPNVRYVVDTGKSKEKQEYNAISALTVQFISKANADQRAGRAGRTAPGHCFRLYTPSLLQRMHDFPTPEILRLPITGFILSILKLGISNVHAFPFLTHPGQDRLNKSLVELVILDAIHEKSDDMLIIDLYRGQYHHADEHPIASTRNTDVNYSISRLGHLMAAIPLGPRMSKLVVKAILLLDDNLFANKFDYTFLIYAVLLASCYYSNLSVTIPARWPIESGSGDAISKLFTTCALLCFKSKADAAPFCKKHGLRYDEAQQVLNTAVQIFNILDMPPMNTLLAKLFPKPPTKTLILSVLKATTSKSFTPEIRATLNWILVQSFPDQLAFRESQESYKYMFQGISIKELLEKPKEYKDLQDIDEIQGKNTFNLTAEQIDLFLQHKPYTNAASLSHLSEVFSCAGSVEALPSCVMYTSAHVELYVRKTIDVAGDDKDKIKQALKISVHLEGMVAVDKTLLCRTPDFLINACFMTTRQTKHYYDRREDVLIGESLLHYVGLPSVKGYERGPMATTIDPILVGPCREVYPGRKYIDDQLQARMAPRILSMILKTAYYRRFLAALLMGEVFPDLKCIKEKVIVDLNNLLSLHSRASSKELDIALLYMQECGIYSKIEIQRYYAMRCNHPNEEQIIQTIEKDRLTTGLANCYRKEYSKAFVSIWKKDIQLILAERAALFNKSRGL